MKKFERKTKDERRRVLLSKNNVKYTLPKDTVNDNYPKNVNSGDATGAAAMTHFQDYNRRFIAAFMALVFVLTTLVVGMNFVVRGEDDSSETPETKAAELESNLVLDKYITPQANGTYDLTLSAFAKGTIKNTTTQVPTDFIFVVDQSGSMAYKDMPLSYTKAEKTTWTIRDIQPQYDVDTEKDTSTAYYYKDPDTGDYYRVYAKWGNMYELIPRQSLYLQSLIDRSGLSWFRSAGEQTQEFDSMYYYQPSYDPLISNSSHPDNALANDNHFYPLTMSVQNAPLYYYMTFSYRDVNGISRNMRWYYHPDEQTRAKSETNNAIFYYNPLNTADPEFGPGDNFVFSYNQLNQTIVYAAGRGLDPVSAFIGAAIFNPDPGYYSRYTYAEINNTLNTGMFVQNPMFIGHVGYNELCYRDNNGVEHYLIKTDYCDENDVPLETADGTTEATWNGTLYTINENGGVLDTETRLQALNTSLHNFVNSVSQQSTEYNTDHRIAIVGFSSDNTFGNNEILSGVTITDGTPGSMGTTPDEPNGNPPGYSLDGKTHNGAQYSASMNQDTCYSALVSAGTSEGKTNLDKAIDSITARGGTQPEIGLDMAKQIITARNNNPEEGQTDRNTIVIFFTDGRPGNYSYVDQYLEAGQVVSKAKEVKDLGATIYTIGVFNESDGNPLTYRESASTGNPSDYSGSNTYIKYVKRSDLQEAINNAGECTSSSNNPISAHYSGSILGGDAEMAVNNATVDYQYTVLSGASWKYHPYPEGKFQQQYRTDYVRHTETLSGNWRVNGFSYPIQWKSGVLNTTHTTNNVAHIPYYQESFYYRDVKANTSGFPEQPNDTIADYMTVVSSTYPNATSFDGGWSALSYTQKNNGNYSTTVGNARGTKEATNYYMSASNADKLEKVFINISGMETVPAVDTSASFVLQDIISDNFHIELNGANDTLANHVEIKEQVGYQDDEYVFHFDDAPVTSPLTPSWASDNKTLNVSGFDFVGNYIAYGKQADYNGSGNAADHGKRLIVTIHDVVPNSDSAGADIASNAAGSSIIMEEPGEGDSIVSTPIEDFKSPAITRYKYDLKVGDVHQAATFNVDYQLTATAPEAESIVVRNATEAARYDQLTNGNFSATVLSNQSRTTDVGNGATVYVEYVTTQPSNDPAAPPATNPADYSLKSTIATASNNTDASQYTYYLSDDHFLNQQNEQIQSNELANVSPITWTANANKSLFVTSKANNVTITIRNDTRKFHGQSEDYSDSTKKFPMLITITKNGSPATDIDGDIGGVTFTDGVGTAQLADDEQVQLTLPVGYDIVVTDATTPTAYTTSYELDDTATVSASTNTNADHNILVIHERNEETIATTGMEDSNSGNAYLYIIAGMAVLSGGAGAAYVYRKKGEQTN